VRTTPKPTAIGAWALTGTAVIILQEHAGLSQSVMWIDDRSSQGRGARWSKAIGFPAFNRDDSTTVLSVVIPLTELR
jgi:hypothetical protein